MATLPVTVYKWDDDNAPVIANGNTSEIINVLKKCLVEGYGDKQPLGWSIALEELANNKIAFRNDTTHGSGSFVVFKGRNTIDDDQGVEFQGCMSMTSFDDLFLEGNPQGFRVKTNYGNHNCDKWIVIGTEIGFYFIADQLGEYFHLGALYNCCFYVGDIISSQTNDLGRFIAIASAILNSAGYAADNSSSGWGISLSYLQNASQSEIKPFAIPQTNGVQLTQFELNKAQGVSNSYTGGNTNILHSVALLTDEAIQDSEGEGSRFSYLTPWFRGTLPGFFMAERNFSKEMLWPALLKFNNTEYLLLKNGRASYRSNTLINMDEWHV